MQASPAETKPRILMVLSYFYPFQGGAENQALLLSEVLRERGLDVFVATRRFKGQASRERIRGVPVYRCIRTVETGMLFSVWYAVSCWVFMFAKRRQYDIIHCHVLQGFHSPAAVLMRFLCKKKTVIKITSSGPVSDFVSLSKVFLGAGILKLIRCADRVIATSAVSAQEALARGFSAGQVALIPNGVDTRRFKPACGYPGVRSRIICVGRLIPGKGTDILIDACGLVRRVAPGVRLEIVGDGPEKKSLVKRAEALGFADAVVFHGEVSAVEQLFDNTCVFVHPSLAEGMSNVILEAMAAGLPVVATRTGAAPEMIRNGINGLLIDAGSAGSIRDAVQKIISDERFAQELGARARVTVEERYSIDSVAAKYMELYQDVMRL